MTFLHVYAQTLPPSPRVLQTEMAFPRPDLVVAGSTPLPKVPRETLSPRTQSRSSVPRSCRPPHRAANAQESQRAALATASTLRLCDVSVWRAHSGWHTPGAISPAAACGPWFIRIVWSYVIINTQTYTYSPAFPLMPCNLHTHIFP